MSWLSNTVSSAGDAIGGVTSNFLGNIFGKPAGQIPGSANPFSGAAADLQKLLLQPTDLTKGFKPIDTSKSDTLFNNLLSTVGAQDTNLTQQMQDLLTGINQDTAQSVGSLKSDFLDRGLGGPSQISDIESSGLADLYAKSSLAKDQARLGLAGQELGLANQAYTTGYTGAQDVSKSNAAMFNDLLSKGSSLTAEDLATMASLFGRGQKSQVEGYLPAQPDIISKILGNTQIKLGLPSGG